MRLLLTLSFLGTHYAGWQVQANAPTVQATVQDALQKCLGVRPSLTGCSRTDSGVHAVRYCCHIDAELPPSMPPEKLPYALNRALPGNIACHAARVVPDDFHARYGAAGKTYRYTLLNTPHRHPFFTATAWHVPYVLDVAAMQTAAQQFVGHHDFASCQSAGSSVQDTWRTVSACSVSRADECVTVEITADGFLYNMVRIITGTLVEVGTGRRAADSIAAMLAGAERRLAGATAPPHGLCLWEVLYC